MYTRPSSKEGFILGPACEVHRSTCFSEPFHQHIFPFGDAGIYHWLHCSSRSHTVLQRTMRVSFPVTFLQGTASVESDLHPPHAMTLMRSDRGGKRENLFPTGLAILFLAAVCSLWSRMPTTFATSPGIRTQLNSVLSACLWYITGIIFGSANSRKSGWYLTIGPAQKNSSLSINCPCKLVKENYHISREASRTGCALLQSIGSRMHIVGLHQPRRDQGSFEAGESTGS